MDLIYADSKRKDIGVLLDFKYDLAYGKDENNFELEVALNNHCCDAGYHLYMEGTEYGGIIDKIRVDTENGKVVYSGRTWHGILEGKVIEPESGADYYIVTGDANEVLAELIDKLGLSELFSASTEASDVDIGQYSFRYAKGYTGICAMLAEFDGKLQVTYQGDSVVLSAVYLNDYSQDEEWDSSQAGFEIERNHRPVNHLICLGSGDLKNRYVIHLFTDENGGVQPYATTDNPMSDADYILTKEKQLLFGSSEVAEVYDYGSVGTTENFEAVTTEPASWGRVYSNYYRQNEDGSYSELEGEEIEELVLQKQKPSDWESSFENYYDKDGNHPQGTKDALYVLMDGMLIPKPSDWTGNYSDYYILKNGEYTSVKSSEVVTYSLQAAKPGDWDNNFKNYYYWYSDGVKAEYTTVPGISKNKYAVQTQKPTDWESKYKSYYVKKKSGGYKSVTSKKKNGKEVAPTWKAKKYYTKQYYQVAPKWQSNKYYTCVKTEVAPQWKPNVYYRKVVDLNRAPEWTADTYYTMTTKILIPRFISGFYYAKKPDHFAELVKGGLERLKQSYECDSISINLDLEGNYDIGDIVGANDNATGISVWQPITKKIVTIQSNRETITYEIG